MTVLIHMESWTGSEVIWTSGGEDPVEILGPRAATIVVDDEPELAPYDLRLRTVLDHGRYVIIQLEVFANAVADAALVNLDFIDGALGQDLTPSTSIPPVTLRGLQTLRLPAILNRALSEPEVVTVRRRDARGRTVTGIGRDDELPVVYCVARAVGEPPTQAVADHFGTTHTAAAQRVARARKAGIIPPVRRGEGGSPRSRRLRSVD